MALSRKTVLRPLVPVGRRQLGDDVAAGHVHNEEPVVFLSRLVETVGQVSVVGAGTPGRHGDVVAGHVVEVEEDLLRGARMRRSPANDLVVLALLGSLVVEVAAPWGRDGGVGLLVAPDGFRIEGLLQARGGGHHRRGVGVFGLEVGDDLRVVGMLQPAVGIAPELQRQRRLRPARSLGRSGSLLAAHVGRLPGADGRRGAQQSRHGRDAEAQARRSPQNPAPVERPSEEYVHACLDRVRVHRASLRLIGSGGPPGSIGVPGPDPTQRRRQCILPHRKRTSPRTRYVDPYGFLSRQRGMQTARVSHGPVATAVRLGSHQRPPEKALARRAAIQHRLDVRTL
ncbi:MAG: hypothetical protein K0Q71_3974 [Thermomicrobiales bacterium]|nr:hypothetical protein [Thermomicrobiales bacterium]